MKRQKILLVISILVVLVLATTAAGPVRAYDVTTYTWTDDFYWAYEGCTVGHKTVSIPGHLTETYYWTDFSDQNGSVKAILHTRGTAYLTYNGRTFNMVDMHNGTFTWPSDMQTFYTVTGNEWLGAVPGHGIIIGIAGNQLRVETCYEKGKKTICNTETTEFSGITFTDYAALCNYLLYGE